MLALGAVIGRLGDIAALAVPSHRLIGIAAAALLGIPLPVGGAAQDAALTLFEDERQRLGPIRLIPLEQFRVRDAVLVAVLKLQEEGGVVSQPAAVGVRFSPCPQRFTAS